MEGHMHGMGGMAPSPPTTNDTMDTTMHRKMMMHMTFFWGKDTDILFQNWPGGKSDMYVLALVVVFLMSVFLQLLSHTRFIKPGSNHIAAGLFKTLLFAFRVGLAYLVMLSIMSFNGGVFLVVVLGQTLGFLISSFAFNKSPHDEGFDLPPISC